MFYVLLLASNQGSGHQTWARWQESVRWSASQCSAKNFLSLCFIIPVLLLINGTNRLKTLVWGNDWAGCPSVREYKGGGSTNSDCTGSRLMWGITGKAAGSTGYQTYKEGKLWLSGAALLLRAESLHSSLQSFLRVESWFVFMADGSDNTCLAYIGKRKIVCMYQCDPFLPLTANASCCINMQELCLPI